jgi:hypothetical protein
MGSEFLFIGLQKWDQGFCLLVHINGIRAFVYWFTEMESEHLFIGLVNYINLSDKWDQSFCLLVYRNGIRAFVYWFTEMGSGFLQEIVCYFFHLGVKIIV